MLTKKDLARIAELRKKASERRKEGRYLIEGEKLFSECPESGVREIYITKKAMSGAVREKAEALMDRVRFEIVSEEEFSRISDTDTPQGIMAVLEMKREDRETFFREGLYVFLEGVQDPGNVGTIVRSSEAAGACGVVLDRNSADLYNPKTIRSTMGSIFRVRCLQTEDLGETIREFRTLGGTVRASALTGSIPYTEARYQGLNAIIIGNESKGVKPETIALSDETIAIPMEGRVESLNAAMAASILLYEAKRQRG